jgi:hypothetical protein
MASICKMNARLGGLQAHNAEQRHYRASSYPGALVQKLISFAQTGDRELQHASISAVVCIALADEAAALAIRTHHKVMLCGLLRDDKCLDQALIHALETCTLLDQHHLPSMSRLLQIHLNLCWVGCLGVLIACLADVISHWPFPQRHRVGAPVNWCCFLSRLQCYRTPTQRSIGSDG